MSLSFNFRIGRSTVCGIVRETCEALWNVLHSKYVQAPSSEDQWIALSRQFEHLWNFPNCIDIIICTHQFPIHHNNNIMLKYLIFALKVQSMASILLSKHRLTLDHSISITRVHIRLSYSLL